MADFGMQWAHMREEFRLVVREELSLFHAQLNQDLPQDLLSGGNARFTTAWKKDDNPQAAVSHCASRTKSLRALAMSLEQKNDVTLPGQPEDTGVVSPPEESPQVLDFLGNQSKNISSNKLVGQSTGAVSTKTIASKASDSLRSSLSENSKRYRKKRARKPRLQKAMGLVPDIEREQVNDSGISKKAEDMVKSHWFEYLTVSVIFASTVNGGLSINHRAINLVDDTPAIYLCMEFLFFLYFLAEVILKLIAFHRQFFAVFGWGWNAFDLALVIFQCSNAVMYFSANGFKNGNVTDVYVIRTLKFFRAVRCLRMMKLTLYARELRLLASCIVHCFSSFCWAGLFLALVIYITGAYLTDMLISVRIEIDEANENDHGLADHYGSVPQSCLSLFEALTGGMDWESLLSPLQQVSSYLPLIFILYIAFGSLAVLNLVTGLFVNGAMERAQAVNDMERLFQAHKLFSALDADSSFYITKDELISHIDDPAVQDFLDSVDMDLTEVHLLFEILDKDMGGSIDFEEFVNGLLHLQGTARSIDLLLMNHEVRSHFRKRVSSKPSC